MNRLTLERRQVGVYLAAVLWGLALGHLAPGVAAQLEVLIWPVLALLLYATFVQIPLLHLGKALRDHRFLAASTLGNFVAVPLLVLGLLRWLPEDPAVRLGVAMVLVMPCTDWFITFTQLGNGDGARAIAVTPFNLLAQFALLPLYLWWLVPSAFADADWDLAEVPPAAGLVIALPLAAAALSERWIEAGAGRERWRERLAWWPVPLLALVLFLVAATQVEAAAGAVPLLGSLVPVFIAFLVAAGLLARGLGRLFRLPRDSGRTLAFSLGTRNSFIVLPIALALPNGGETVVVIVLQSLVELFGMVLFLWWIPRRLFR